VDSSGKIAYQRSGGVDSADEVADLVREHLGVDLTTPSSSSAPPLRSSDEELVGEPGARL